MDKEPYIEDRIIREFEEIRKEKAISLRKAEKILKFSDTYISRVVNSREKPSERVLFGMVSFIKKNRQ